MIFTAEQRAVTSADQDRVIAELDRLNGQASSLDGCDPANKAALEEIDNLMALLRVILTSSGLTQDEVGKWGPAKLDHAFQ